LTCAPLKYTPAEHGVANTRAAKTVPKNLPPIVSLSKKNVMLVIVAQEVDEGPKKSTKWS
jgi:hypothetical protein